MRRPGLLCMRRRTRSRLSDARMPRDHDEQDREKTKMGTIKHSTIQIADYAVHSRIASP